MSECKSLARLFAALRRSKAPWSSKLSALPIKFWSFALRGISACPIPDSLLQAVRALKAAPAGASPALRLSLSATAAADSDFFQCWSCLTTMRRLCGKQPRLLALWSDYMQCYDGRLFPGPFSELLVVLNGIGWKVGSPPFIIDEEDLSRDLLLTPLPALRRLTERAWLSSLAHAHQHRPSMSGLNGIDPGLAQLDQNRLSPTDAARVAALQSGALMFGEAQARFDLTQSGLCPQCQVPDSKEHRVLHCPLFQEARAGHACVLARWDSLPPCLKLHLLPPVNTAAVELRALLHQSPDCSQHFLSEPTDGVQHLFC